MKTLWKILTLSALLWFPIQADVKHFQTLDKAVETFIKAVEDHDKTVLEELFAEHYWVIVNEKKLDRNDAKYFLDKYNEANALVTHDDKEIYISVGKSGWTFPIPLSEDKNGWHFNLGVGMENMITREIGRNEIAVIEALHAGVDLQTLKASPLADIYLFLEPIDETLEIVALPKEYQKTAIMSFVRTKEGKVLEADLKEKVYRFDKQFKIIHQDYINTTH